MITKEQALEKLLLSLSPTTLSQKPTLLSEYLFLEEVRRSYKVNINFITENEN